MVRSSLFHLPVRSPIERRFSTVVGVSANGAGDVLLEARGAGSDVIIAADVISGTGNITLDAGNDLDGECMQ